MSQSQCYSIKDLLFSDMTVTPGKEAQAQGLVVIKSDRINKSTNHNVYIYHNITLYVENPFI